MIETKPYNLTEICRPKQWPTIPMSSLTETGYPVYGANGKIGFYREFTHAEPTLLITCRGATCGELNICEAFSYVTGNAMALDELDEKVVNLYYLYFTLAKRGLKDTITGSAQPQITRESLSSVVVNLPPLDEQKRIAARLGKADRLRRLRRYALEVSEGYLQSLFLDMFGDPATNPMGWEKYILSEVGELDRGRSRHRPRNAAHLYGGDYPFVQTGDISNSGGYITEYQQTYSEAGLQQSKLWVAGTLCITIAANIAKTGILTFDACFPDSVVGFTPKHSDTVEFIQSWFSFMQKSLEDSAPESAQKNINLEILRDLIIAFPPVALQKQFGRIVQQHQRLRAQQREALRQADHLFQTLLHQAFDTN